MMKANELRIGNWYENQSGDLKPNGRYSQVEKIDDLHFAELMLAIPLTPEWLERFGFENHKLILPYHGAFQSYLIAEIGAARVQICKNGYFAYDPEIRYVHQLQNLYFALTGEELKIAHQVKTPPQQKQEPTPSPDV